MKSMNLKFLSLLSIVALVAACGQADLSGTLSSMKGASNSNNSSSGGVSDPWAGVETSASASNMFGTQGFEIDKNNNLLKLVFDLPVNIFGGSMKVDIKEIPGAYVAIEPNVNSGQWQLSFNIPLQYLVRGINLVGPKTLPNGDELPGVPGGEPPRIAAHIVKNNIDLYLYGSVKYFGLYVPTPKFNPFLDLTFPIKNKDKTKILGYFATVSAKNGYSGGLFISIVFPPELARVLDDLFG
ncbi:MAG: hypothetical protein IPM57_01195 [Oligoflexia bacterium]|nr:hypothetical protein [Oligoflexia bacterium]